MAVLGRAAQRRPLVEILRLDVGAALPDVDHGLDQNFEYLDASLKSRRKKVNSLRRIREINR